MKFEKRRLADLHPAEYNPRVTLRPEDSEYQQIQQSIVEFGYSDPIVINYDGTIIKGHQRRNVMMDLGYTEAEVIVLDIRDKQKEKALNVALNKITGKWDNAILKDLLLELDLEGYDFSVTGFVRQDLEDLIQLVDIQPEAKDAPPQRSRSRSRSAATSGNSDGTASCAATAPIRWTSMR